MGETIRFLAERGVPVMAHVGLTRSLSTRSDHSAPRAAKKPTGRVSRKTRLRSAGGCISVVIEAVAEPLARKLTAAVPIPTIGIGASVACDGQILVLEDMLGLCRRGFQNSSSATARLAPASRRRSPTTLRRYARALFPGQSTSIR